MTTTEDEQALRRLYQDFDDASVRPLWLQTGDLMTREPAPAARPHRWAWAALESLAVRAGELVPVGRGGERRAIALANPGLGGRPFATPTLWAAVQYLAPGETAPAHRHTQGAFRFILDGQGVWTVVDGDPVAMRRGDLLLTPGWAWHEHQNPSGEPMMWLDGLDIPLVSQLDAGFFETGPAELTDDSTPVYSHNERLWAHPGLRPVSAPGGRTTSPLLAYRWEHTDAALAAQLELDDEGRPGVLGPGHAAVRFVDPATGSDALPTMRMEMHRVRAGTRTAGSRKVGSMVWQLFNGSGVFHVDGSELTVEHGDLVVLPSWCRFSVTATSDADLFVFSDAPVYEALGLDRAPVVQA